MDTTTIAVAVIAGGGVVSTAVIGLVGPILSRVAKLEERMGAIEVENRDLRSLFEVAVSFIHRVGIWIEDSTDMRERPEVPEQLRTHVDVSPWEPTEQTTHG